MRGGRQRVILHLRSSRIPETELEARDQRASFPGTDPIMSDPTKPSVQFEGEEGLRRLRRLAELEPRPLPLFEGAD